MAGGNGARQPLADSSASPNDSGSSRLRSDVHELRRNLDEPPQSAVDRLHPADEEFLDQLETTLRDPSGADRMLDPPSLAQCLGMRSVDLVRRVVAALGCASDGCVGADALLAGVKRVLYGGPGERRRFAFRIHDLDGDGAIDRSELRRMIALGLAEDDVTVREGMADRLAAILLRKADRSRDGRLSFAEFEEALSRHPDVAASIEKSGARWLVVNEDAADRLDPESPRSSRWWRFRRAVDNRAPYIVFLTVWAVANVFFFEHARRAYAASNGFIQVARGSGACLNFNGAIILLPMMRRALSAVRKTPLRRILPLDDAIDIHTVAGHAMFGFALVHSAAHIGNYARMPTMTIFARLASTGAARTGILWLAIFATMWFFARASARARRRFEVFHATHSLYVVWFAVGLLHGPVFWKWVSLPVLAFLVERAVRRVRSSVPAEIIRTRVMRSGVTRLDLCKPRGFHHRPGDFVFLRIPRIAEHEWHPLTISSAPERETLSFHVRARGDWTAALRRLAETRRFGHSSDPLLVSIDGPYGAPCTAVFGSRRAVLIAGGIGVTPFASVLESIVLRSRANASVALECVDFVWLNGDQYSFEWFVELLSSVERLDERGLVRIHVYMTGGRSDPASAIFELARRAALLAGETDVVTGLRIETHMGAPDWRTLLGSIARDAAGTPVDAYFCGPPGLGRKVAPICADVGMTFRQERF
jgi:predicted ferric reductase/Ca2+-binding EF-hand superfamily protein